MRTLHINMWYLMLVLINLQGCISVSHVEKLTKGETCLDIVAMDPKNFRKRLNCSTDPNSREWYHCLADQDNIVEYELCSNWKWIEKGKCAYYNPYGEGNVDERYDPCVTDNNRTCSSEQFESMYNTNYSGCYPFGVEQTTFMTSTIAEENPAFDPTKDKRNEVSSALGITFGILIPVVLIFGLVIRYRQSRKASKGVCGETKGDSHIVDMETPTPDNENASATTSTPKHTSDQHHAGPTSKTPSDEKIVQDGDEESVTETTPMLKSNDHHTDTKDKETSEHPSHHGDEDDKKKDDVEGMGNQSNVDESHGGTQEKFDTPPESPMLPNLTNSNKADIHDKKEVPSEENDDITGQPNENTITFEIQKVNGKRDQKAGQKQDMSDKDSTTGYDTGVQKTENGGFETQDQDNKKHGSIPKSFMTPAGDEETVHETENTEHNKQMDNTSSTVLEEQLTVTEKVESDDGYVRDTSAEEKSGKRKLSDMSGITISDTLKIGKSGIDQSVRTQGESENETEKENLVNKGLDDDGDDNNDDASSLHSLEPSNVNTHEKGTLSPIDDQLVKTNDDKEITNLKTTDGGNPNNKELYDDDDASSLHSLKSSDDFDIQEKDEVLQNQMYDTLETVCINIVKMLFYKIAEYEVGPLDVYFSTGLKKAQVKDLLEPEYKFYLSPGEKQVDIDNLPVPVFYAALRLSMNPEKAPKSEWGRSVKREDKGVGDDIERIMKIYTSYRCIQDPKRIPIETYERWRKIMLAATARLDKEYSTCFSDNVKNPELQLGAHINKFSDPMPIIM